MEVNPQTSHNIEIVTKKKISIRTVLNIYGAFTFLGLILSIFTVPITINGDMEFFRNEMKPKEIKELLLFTFVSAFIYYFLVNIYFIGQLWRKVFFATLILLFGFSIFMIFYLLNYPTPH
ncbi:MAG: hypothetical protein ACQEWV_24500 [Bacillota bacterium]